MAFTSTQKDYNSYGNSFAKVYSFDLDTVTTGIIASGFSSVQFASSSIAGVDIVLNSNDGTEDTLAGSVHITGTQDDVGYIKLEGI